MSHGEYRKFHGATVESDWQRLRILRQICDQADRVSTPATLRLGLAQQTIVYEYVDFPTPLVHHVGDEGVFRMVGATLAQMHQTRFDVEPGYFSDEPYPIDSLGLAAQDAGALRKFVPVGWLHGDFWHGNIFCDPVERLVIVDPLPARWLFVERYILASGALDLASMYMGLVLCHPLRRQIAFDVEPYLRSGEALLDSYLAQVGAQSQEVYRAVRRLSRKIGLRFIDSYSRRLGWPLARVKQRVALRILDRLDRRIDWRDA